ncbi:hypothetical protein [uncultured Caulobacter sp.]|mgnify:CR=1 FL=1|uniref:phage head completion protein n=1 Tax=uncultured Caulobacter sp. TaxID=158749 RepID=UPI002630FDA5|nr:hypothetical protein [uncultured Caulobacter sp.]
MAWTPPSRHELRQRVRIERRGAGKNVGGVVKDQWTTAVEDRRVRLLPQRGGDAVIADRVAGVSIWIMDIPADSQVRAIGGGVGLRVVDARDVGRTFKILSCLDLEGRDRWRTLTLQLGATDG